ncbi:pentapeptide repeat-containing protein [Actinophytocola algeriensis]|uniref:Uncharacterized protein YjbI with pentapeptide repeats n=1 Tax=Actinophytocola algeriensis TaxID=1768010 RepID=A0A7W7QF49_9PSEU|nr:pentapeptide repeat-containing protein [Actinophytocola algeriensis]MBB4912427.1 uncharacterized protein YjbI with pentapeptide repeats [Actinophytocola algeriensis]MBE1481000.1 uncharacterized protein YjbI with pentapeptide repeats [Actinophytocola algeriensis]
MGDWLAPVAGGLVAGVAVAVLAYLCRDGTRTWTGGGRLAVLLVVAIVLGAATPVLLRPPEDTRPVTSAGDDTLTRTVARLKSADLDERLAALAVLDRLAQQYVGKVPAIFAALAEFVRRQAPEAGDQRCAGSVPAADVGAALATLRARPYDHDVTAAVDLHGTCLAGADLRGLRLPGGTLADADLSGASLRSADLTRADLARANLAGASLAGSDLIDTRFADTRFAETELSHARFSDDTLWPSQHEDAVMAASSFATTTFVIGELVLSDPR